VNDIDISEMLKEPFDVKQIRWRVGATTKDNSKGIALAYIDARDVMNRFDQVVGSLWQCRYPGEGLCEIGLKIDGEWIWRANGAGETAVEGEKGQYSDAFKRAAVLWGIGRYLYYLPNSWVPLKPQGRSHVIVNPPSLPYWALPHPINREKAKAKQTVKVEEKINPKKNSEHLKSISMLIDQTETDIGTFIKAMKFGVAELNLLNEDQCLKAIAALENKKSKMKEAEKSSE